MSGVSSDTFGEMRTTAQVFAITIDCADPESLATLYQNFLGGDMQSSNPISLCWRAIKEFVSTSNGLATPCHRGLIHRLQDACISTSQSTTSIKPKPTCWKLGRRSLLINQEGSDSGC